MQVAGSVQCTHLLLLLIKFLPTGSLVDAAAAVAGVVRVGDGGKGGLRSLYQVPVKYQVQMVFRQAISRGASAGLPDGTGTWTYNTYGEPHIHPTYMTKWSYFVWHRTNHQIPSDNTPEGDRLQF